MYVCMCDELNLPAMSLLNSRGFQLADFTKKLSFLSYTCSLFFVFARGQVDHFQVATWQVCLTILPMSVVNGLDTYVKGAYILYQDCTCVYTCMHGLIQRRAFCTLVVLLLTLGALAH